MVASEDEAPMALALREAEKGLGRTRPNPAVGAVIVRDGAVVGTGFHRKAGAAHAEVSAIAAAGDLSRGSTLYSTLEPCNHSGRTGPCTEAIIEAGIERVVIGALDPNPKVQGRGRARLRRAGLRVGTGVLAAECRRLNEAYNFAIRNGRPFVCLKVAASLDGRTATRTGQSKWITSEAARKHGRRMRGRVDAIVAGVETIRKDDSLLTTRARGRPDPVRVIVDSRLRTPTTAKVLQTAASVRTIFATTKASPARRRARFEDSGAEVHVLPATRDGRVRLDALLAGLHDEGLLSVLVEGGATLHGAFVDGGLVNKVQFFLAPTLIGGASAHPAIGGKGARTLDAALALGPLSVEQIGAEILVTGYTEER